MLQQWVLHQVYLSLSSLETLPMSQTLDNLHLKL